MHAHPHVKVTIHLAYYMYSTSNHRLVELRLKDEYTLDLQQHLPEYDAGTINVLSTLSNACIKAPLKNLSLVYCNRI